jgi:hypothetical protein
MELAGCQYQAFDLISLPLGTLFVLVLLLTGEILTINGIQFRRRSADTRMIEELRVVDDSSPPTKTHPAP